MNKTRIRVILFAGSGLIALIVLVFLLLLNLGQSAELKRTFLGYVAVLWIFSTIAFGVFFFKWLSSLRRWRSSLPAGRFLT
jgi:hypothetical protein